MSTVCSVGANPAEMYAPSAAWLSPRVQTQAKVTLRRADQLHRLGHEASSDALAALAGPDVELRDLRLETGSRVEEHDPAQPDRLAARRPGNQDVVLAGESRSGR